jgi:phage tail-like protein
MADLFARAFRFQVTLSNSPSSSARGTTAANGTLGDGAFAECSGLDLEMDVGEYLEGGRNNGVLQRAGRAKVARIVLRRGMLHPAGGRVNTELWQWLQDVLDGVRPIRRYDGIVTVLDERVNQPVATWKFSRGLPAKLVGPQLNARTGEVAIEELQIAHEGLRMQVR